jgi:hypothetical protein
MVNIDIPFDEVTAQVGLKVDHIQGQRTDTSILIIGFLFF